MKLSTLSPTNFFSNGSFVYTVSGNQSYKQSGRQLGLGILNDSLSGYSTIFNSTVDTVGRNSALWSGSISGLFDPSLSAFYVSTYNQVKNLSGNWNTGYTTSSSVSANLSALDVNKEIYSSSLNNFIDIASNDLLIDRFGTCERIDTPIILAITKSQRVIGWGGRFGNSSGTDLGSTYGNFSLLTTPTVSPSDLQPVGSLSCYPNSPVYINFITLTGGDYLCENKGVSVIDLQYNKDFAIAVLSDGTVWGNGRNIQYFLGYIPPGQSIYDQYTYGFYKIRYDFPKKVISVALRGQGDREAAFAAIIEYDPALPGNLYLWGNNASEALGNSATSLYSPTLITTLKGVVSCNIGDTSRGTLVLCGSCIDSSTGIQYTSTEGGNVLAVVGRNNNGAIGLGPSLVSTGSGWYVPTNSGVPFTNISKIEGVESCSNSFIIDVSGNLWGTGVNAAGQLGVGDFVTRTYFTRNLGSLSNVKYKDVSVVEGATVNRGTVTLLDTDNKVYLCGDNLGKQINSSTDNSISTPYFVGYGKYIRKSCRRYDRGSSIFLSAGNNILLGAGHKIPARSDWQGWIYRPAPYTLSYTAQITASTTYGFSAINLNIPQTDPIKDWVQLPVTWAPNYNPSVGIGATDIDPGPILVLTDSGHVYGIGVSQNHIFGKDDRTTGTGVLLI